jgi:hypothetical protein
MESNENKRIIEINGIKLEVDLSTARRIDEFKVGDNVKVLRKQYSDSYKVEPGVITEFVNFKERPTIVIAVFKDGGYNSEPSIEFIYLTQDTTGVEIAACCEHELKLNRETVAGQFQRQIEKKHKEADELQAKFDYFMEHFGHFIKEEK